MLLVLASLTNVAHAHTPKDGGRLVGAAALLVCVVCCTVQQHTRLFSLALLSVVIQWLPSLAHQKTLRVKKWWWGVGLY